MYHSLSWRNRAEIVNFLLILSLVQLFCIEKSLFSAPLRKVVKDMENIKISVNTPLMLGVKETAERFGIAQHYARQLALSGKVKAVRVGRNKILINAQSVADFFDSSYINSPETVQTAGIKPIPVKL